MKCFSHIKSRSGNALPWILLLVVIAAAVVLFLIKPTVAERKSLAELPATPTLEPTPEPTSAPTPEPTPTPTPGPVVEATPTPEPALDFPAIAADESLWPKQVSLVRQTAFPLVMNGKPVGKMQAPAGTTLPLVQVLPDTATPTVIVRFQSREENVSADDIDLIARARELNKSHSDAQTVERTAPRPTRPVATPAPQAKPEFDRPLTTRREFASRITVDVDRIKRTKVEGGDFDDKRDRIKFNIAFRDRDPNRPFPGLKFEFYLFAQSITNTRAYKLLQKFEKSFALEPLKELEFSSPEVVTEWDDTGAIFGAKYKGWYLVIRNADGEIMEAKKSISIFDDPAGLSRTTEGASYNRKFEPVIP